ncbi:S-adenosyl-L-methionine-dependent methyltransferase [Protomyces lactucae-debilis]|uniref:S-adenosyl-L-methionine-dependent methyltransferase n=1 Tax=Protomyces lactucae-debilis TaxID=2754530 RepID=A0A1Y2FGW9_PROLT|nr:S-adenosyl-L-methionine-dependent methyltransferase [Protomyces lactucae-debilis]ORY83198.1 S-adenosyl-L-methionine-dependent methyltransferase [Protomyces lactucae-debilis]
MTDLSMPMLKRDVMPAEGMTVERTYVDEESLPFPDKSLDAVVSNLSMHWINDLPSTLLQIKGCLKPDGAFIGSLFGGDTLFELRTALQLAELERSGGISPRVSPMTDVKDVGSLLNKAGFKLTTVDVDDIVVEYPDIFALMQDLQAMGETNAILQRRQGPISRDLLMAADAIYRSLHAERNATGQIVGRGIPATFRVIYMIGWAPGAGQSAPSARGSADTSLKDTLASMKEH